MDYFATAEQFTPKKSVAGRLPDGNPIKMPSKRGCFMDGVWYCNCTRRLPASHFQVKKESVNKGRWFYTCQQPKEQACGFFLWDDEAKSREMKAVINNSRSEAESSATPKKPEIQVHNSGVSGGYHTSKNSNAVDLDKDDDDEFGDWQLTADDERVAVEAVEAAERAASMKPPETPRKAIKTSAFATPRSKRKLSGEGPWPTPLTGGASPQTEDIFRTPTVSRSQLPTPNSAATQSLISPSTSPTPNRRLDFSSVAATGATGSADYDITEEVLELLKGQPIEAEALRNLRQVLNRYALKNSGIQKGRDVTRLALKARDAKIEDLQQQIATLESKHEMDKAVIRHFKDDMSASVSRRARGQGRGS